LNDEVPVHNLDLPPVLLFASRTRVDQHLLAIDYEDVALDGIIEILLQLLGLGASPRCLLNKVTTGCRVMVAVMTPHGVTPMASRGGPTSRGAGARPP